MSSSLPLLSFFRCCSFVFFSFRFRFRFLHSTLFVCRLFGRFFVGSFGSSTAVERRCGFARPDGIETKKKKKEPKRKLKLQQQKGTDNKKRREIWVSRRRHSRRPPRRRRRARITSTETNPEVEKNIYLDLSFWNIGRITKPTRANDENENEEDGKRPTIPRTTNQKKTNKKQTTAVGFPFFFLRRSFNVHRSALGFFHSSVVFFSSFSSSSCLSFFSDHQNTTLWQWRTLTKKR